MSAKKTAVYTAVNYILLAAALALTILLILKGDIGEGSRVVVCALVCVAAGLQAHTLIHELGHLLIGLLTGFRPVSFTVAFVRFSRIGKRISFVPNAAVAGACEMFPVGRKGLFGRLCVYTLGGAAFNFIFSTAVLLLYFLLPPSWILLTLAALAPLNLYECVMELLPAHLPAGKTDGCFLRDLMQKEAGACNTYAVFEAQSLLAKGSFSALPRALLYDVPVVREDDPAFLSLLSLRMMRAAIAEESEDALNAAKRLYALSEYLPPIEAYETAADCICVFSRFGYKDGSLRLPEEGKNMSKCVAFWRMKTLFGPEGERLNARKRWEKDAKKLPMQGQREWENFWMEQMGEIGGSLGR